MDLLLLYLIGLWYTISYNYVTGYLFNSYYYILTKADQADYILMNSLDTYDTGVKDDSKCFIAA